LFARALKKPVREEKEPEYVKKAKELRKVYKTQDKSPAKGFFAIPAARPYSSILKDTSDKMLGMLRACGRLRPRYSRLPARK